MEPDLSKPTEKHAATQEQWQPGDYWETMAGLPKVTQACTYVAKDLGTIVLFYKEIHFLPSQSLVVVHVSLEPALDSAPTVKAEILEGHARIRITDRQRFGVRLELTRSGPCSADLRVRLGLTIGPEHLIA